jgi:dolichyl-phosphate-mannose--protein O-mannosyl transferase
MFFQVHGLSRKTYGIQKIIVAFAALVCASLAHIAVFVLSFMSGAQNTRGECRFVAALKLRRLNCVDRRFDRPELALLRRNITLATFPSGARNRISAALACLLARSSRKERVADSADIRSAKRTTSWTSVAIALCALFVLFRLFALLVTPLELGPDEAQYWRWSQTPAWGYFSKPPLIAWAIGATTHFFGDSEWAVRLFAPIAHAFCALFLARAAQRLAGKDAAAPAALLYLVAPGVAVSSFLASTDALLLACSAAALLGALRIRERNDVTGHAIVGIALGLGLLAKYAMIYTVGGIAVAALFDRPLRQALLTWKTVIGIALAGLLIAPNLYWNATNSFATCTRPSSTFAN